MTVAEPSTRKWTRQEYYRLAGEGWFDGQRIQLIGGEIVQMPPQGHRHAKAILALSKYLQSIYGDNHWVRCQLPLNLLERSEPEPDFAVTADPPQSYSDHPTSAILVVEISDTTLRLDRRKISLYAAAGIPEYWILDLQGSKLEIYRRPIVQPDQEFGFGYSERFEPSADQAVAPLSRPDSKILVQALFQ